MTRPSKRDSFTDELMDVLATVAGQSVGTRRRCRYPSQCSSEFWLSEATKLMKAVAVSVC